MEREQKGAFISFSGRDLQQTLVLNGPLGDRD